MLETPNKYINYLEECHSTCFLSKKMSAISIPTNTTTSFNESLTTEEKALLRGYRTILNSGYPQQAKCDKIDDSFGIFAETVLETVLETRIYDEEKFNDKYFEEYDKSRSEFIEFTQSQKFRTHNSNDLISNNSSTLGNTYQSKNVGKVLEFVLSKLFSGKKFKIVEIGAGNGINTPGIVSSMTDNFCDLFVLTDPIYKPSQKFVPRKNMPETIRQGLTNPKSAQQSKQFAIAIERRIELWKESRAYELRKSSSYETPFRIISEATSMGVFDVISKIKQTQLNNSILFICCPPPFEGHISTDVISLMETIDIKEIKYVIIVRHEAERLDGTNNFSQHVNMLSYLGHWHKVYSQRVCSYCSGSYSSAYWRRMYVFSRNKSISFKK